MKQWIYARAEEEYLAAVECIANEERCGSVAWQAFKNAHRNHAVRRIRVSEN
jgi:hypothetical protein